jgi:hypothetical protein
MQKPWRKILIQLFAEPHHMHVNGVIQRRMPGYLFPHVTRNHCPGHHLPGMKKQILKEVKFSRSQLNRLAASRYRACDEIHLKIVEL